MRQAIGRAAARLWDTLRTIGRHIGRRGAFLLFLTLLDMVIGYALRQPLPLGLDPKTFYGPFLAIAPLEVWATAWVAVGVLAGVAAFWHQLRVTAFTLAPLIKTAWAAGYLNGWLNHDPAFSRGYLSAAIYGAFGLITVLVSSWRENGT